MMEMAKKVTVSFLDDLDGKTAADETVAFTLDEVAYEIDLSTQNAEKLRATGFCVRGGPRRRVEAVSDLLRETS